jgi:phage tail sheath protein FI
VSVSTSFPGIYIQELSSSSHAIVPAPTSIAAFVGYSHPFQTAAFNVAQECFSFNDYQTFFGPLFSSGLVDASLPRAVNQFFLNGGSTAWVVGLQPGLFDSNDDVIPSMPVFGLASGQANASGATANGGTAAATFTVNAANLVPTISSLSPGSVPLNTPNFTLTINGANFVSGATVSWTPQPPAAGIAATFVSDTQLTVDLTLGAAAGDFPNTVGVVQITVTNPGAPTAGGTSAAAAFTVSAASGPAAISSLSPVSVAAGSPSFLLTISGSNFVPGATVSWTPSPPTPAPIATFVSSTQLTLSVTPGSAAGDFPDSAGSVDVTVTNPGQSAPPPSVFRVTSSNPVPVLSSLSPSNVIAGGAAFTLNLNGNNFVPASTVTLSNSSTPLTPVFVNNSQLAVTMPASAIASAITSLTVSVSNPVIGGGGGTSAALPLVVNAGGIPTPTISSVSPSSVTVGYAAPLTITVNGANFAPTSTVSLNSVALAAASVSVVDATQLTVSAPALGAGPVSLTVTNPSNGVGIVFTALEFTDIVPMTVTITNIRNGGGTFDAVITYGSRIETYRGIQLTGPTAQQPAGVINGVSKLVQVAAATGGYGTTVAPQQISLAFALPTTLNTCFSAADYLPVFEPNSSLDNLEIFNLLMVPGVTDFSVVGAALAFAERKRAFAIVDPPPQAPAFGSSIATPQPIQYWMEGLYSPSGPILPLSQNGGLYFPYLNSNDPVTGNNIPMAPSGFVAGIYAATDASRGVWKAPAGLATNINNTTGPVLSGIMNDPEQGVLNLDSINCLRTFSGAGTVVWGSRTLVAANSAFQQSKYVPVRRMTLFIEQTLLANLRWVVFEPNDEDLWIAIKSTIEAFLLSLYRQGGLQGETPNDAFQVKCDSTTTTPTDQQNGIVNIVVAFAPLKPAEFVIIQIAQLAGQTAGS